MSFRPKSRRVSPSAGARHGASRGGAQQPAVGAGESGWKHLGTTSSDKRSAWQLVLICVCLALAIMAVYGRVGDFAFVDLDDRVMVQANTDVKEGLTPGSIFRAFTGNGVFFWQPITSLSHILDGELFEFDAGYHHWENVVLHACNAILLFFFLLRTFGHPLRCALVSAMFALHPLRVESVAWISERQGLLCALFSILTLWAYVSNAERRRSRQRYGVVVLLFCLALMSKPTAISLPLVMLLLDRWPLNRFAAMPARALVKEKLPLFAAAALSAVITVITNTGPIILLDSLPLRLRIAATASAGLGVLERFVWPSDLSVRYPAEVSSLTGIAAAGFVLVVLTLLAFVLRRRAPYFHFGWLWYLATLAPVIGLQTPGMIMSDRFTYLAFTGPCIAVVWWAADALRSHRPRLRQVGIGAALALLLAWSVVSWRQAGHWRDGAALSQHADAVAAKVSARTAAATGFAATSVWRPLTRDEALETGVLLGFLVIAFGWPEWGRAWFGRVERVLANLARRPVRAMAVAALLPLAIRLLWLPIYPIPEPLIHDEFGHLLIGDTFASGRLANPAHPMREHFETVYVLQEPSYASYYPVGQGALLGLTQLARLNPWFAIWASVGLMCGALFWMLAGWLPPRWALVGALMAGMRFGILCHWMNSFWGGALAAVGGALVFGSLPRVYRGLGVRYAALMGLGLAILLQTRPYEGALLSIPVALALGVWLLRTKAVSWRSRIVGVILPLVAVLLGAGAWTAYYDWRVTGDPLVMPYQLYQKEYGVPAAFYWQENYPPGKSLRLPELEQTYRWQVEHHNARNSWTQLAAVTLEKLRSLWEFYFGPLWTLPLLAVPWLWTRRRFRFHILTVALVLFGVGMYPFFFPHYLAPICGLLMLAVVEGIRRMSLLCWRGRPVGTAVARVVVAVSLAGAILAPAGESVMNGDWLVHRNTPRQGIIETLESSGGKHLVIVRYGPEHSFHESLVQNGADIDHSRIVWARDLGEAKNRELIAYYPDRKVWSCNADQKPVSVVPYGPTREP